MPTTNKIEKKPVGYHHHQQNKKPVVIFSKIANQQVKTIIIFLLFQPMATSQK
jgi:hypothetical protein